MKNEKKIDPAVEKVQKTKIILNGIANNIKKTSKLKNLTIQNLKISNESAILIRDSLKSNKSISNLCFQEALFESDSYDIIMNSIIVSESIENFSLINCNFDDKISNLIGRFITRQNQRRDEFIWMYNLRNEKPLSNDFAKGLISLDLSNNNLQDQFAETVCYSLSSDNYIRKMNLSNNFIGIKGCKAFSTLLKTNQTLLNVNLKNNPGYEDVNINSKIKLRLIKNINRSYTDKMTDFSEIKKYIDFGLIREMKKKSIEEDSSKENNNNHIENDKEIVENLERQIENQNRNEEEYQIQKEMNQHKMENIFKNDLTDINLEECKLFYISKYYFRKLQKLFMGKDSVQ